MSDPDVIWAWARGDNWEFSGHCTSNQKWAVEGDLKYRRADLPPTDAEVLSHPKVKALVEAANDMCLIAERDEWHKAMTGRQIILRNLRAALAAIQKKETSS